MQIDHIADTSRTSVQQLHPNLSDDKAMSQLAHLTLLLFILINDMLLLLLPYS